nr:DmsC/YnfH family molybdoenzyme membrane anchor subunit [Plesiomonas shigelloides]
MHELPLVFFTVLTQSAVGAYLLLLLWQSRQPVGSDRCASIKLLGVVALFALGGVMGSVHLGQPLRALNMLAGVGRSPMSNEIVLSGIFIACAGLGALLRWRQAAPGLSRALLGVAVPVGLLFVWTIPQIYQLDTVPHWASGHVTLMHLLTVFIGGGALACALGVTWARWVMGLGIVAAFTTKLGYAAFIASSGGAALAAVTGLWQLQTALLALALLLAARQEPKWLPALVAVAVIAAELLGRIAFYDLWQIGM